jgi:hypothetical protein
VVGEKPSGLLTAELTGDAAPDLALLNRRADDTGEVIVLRNDGAGRYTAEATRADCPFFTGGTPCRLFALAAADFDRNNRVDLVIALEGPRRTGQPGHPRDAMQIFARGSARFVPGPVFAIAQSPVAVLVGKLSADCMPEVVVAGRRAPDLRVFVNASTGSGLPLGNGERCVRSADCVSGHCIDARCCAEPCAGGERCDVDAQCALRVCDVFDGIPIMQLQGRESADAAVRRWRSRRWPAMWRGRVDPLVSCARDVGRSTATDVGRRT